LQHWVSSCLWRDHSAYLYVQDPALHLSSFPSLTSSSLNTYLSIFILYGAQQTCNRNPCSHNKVKGVWWFLFPFYSASHQPHMEKPWAIVCDTCSTWLYSLTHSVLHIKYSAIFWMRKLSRVAQVKFKYILNFSTILCNILLPIQYWKQQNALTQTSCRSGIERKAASVQCTASTGGNAGDHLGCESQKRLMGNWVP
jgi:hypothetical protein